MLRFIGLDKVVIGRCAEIAAYSSVGGGAWFVSYGERADFDFGWSKEWEGRVVVVVVVIGGHLDGVGRWRVTE